MGSRDRYVVIGTMVLAFLAALALSHAFNWIFVQLGIDDPYVAGLREIPVSTALAYGVAVAAATFVLKHGPTRTLAGEIVEELSRVTWPSREETGNATVVVIVTVIIASAYLGAFDAMWLWLTDLILGIDAPPQG